MFGIDRLALRHSLALTVVLGMVAVSAVGNSGAPTSRVVFSEAFDDDELGAAPMGVAGPNSAVIETNIGYVLGAKASAGSALSVIREDSSEDGNCLSIGDFDPVPGGPVASFVPQRGSGDKKYSIGFDLRRVVADPGAILTLVAIDNRTTPGTGRMLGFALTGADGKLFIGGTDTGFALGDGEAYRFAIDLDIDANGPDSWQMMVWNLADPEDAYQTDLLRTYLDVGGLSEVQAGAQGANAAFATLDNIEIIDAFGDR